MSIQDRLNQLYEEVYEPKLLPQDLLENLKHENYLSVEFTKNGKETIGITKCYLSNHSIAEYKYIFLDNKLTRLEEYLPNIITPNILYDRETTIEEIKSELKNMLQLQSAG